MTKNSHHHPSFDPRSRARSDHLAPNRHVCPGNVSIRAPVRGATNVSSPCCVTTKRFDPRSRARSDSIATALTGCDRGFDPRSRARSDVLRHQRHRCVQRFDPRSRARSDKTAATDITAAVEFRSALPCEERRQVLPQPCLVAAVSIRAPVRGATPPQCPPPPPMSGFDPRSRARSDLMEGIAFGLRRPFRSALPCEERHAVGIVGQAMVNCFDPRSRARSDATPTAIGMTWPGGFDPRSRARSDAPPSDTENRHDVSIRAPVRGATRLHAPR